MPVLLFLLASMRGALGSTLASITIGGAEQGTDASTIAVAFNGFSEAVHYDATSTPASVASAFAAMFSRDFLSAGLCASASGNVISFKLKAGSFGALTVTGSSASFQLSGSGFAGLGASPSSANPGGLYTGTIGMPLNFSGASSDPQGSR